MSRYCRLLWAGVVASFTVLSAGWSQTPFALNDVKPLLIQGHRAKEAGVVDSVDVRIGDKVSEGQILVKLDHDRQLHAYLVAKTRADNDGGIMIAEGDLLEKNSALADVQLKYRRRQVTESQVAQVQGQVKSSQGRLEQAKMNDELADLELKLAEKMLERRFVRCTLKGTVVDVNKSPGDRAGEGDVVVTVADLSSFTAMIPMTKESAAKLAANAALPVKLAGTSITRFAQVVGITPMANGTKGEQMVQIAFDNADPFSLIKQKAYEVVLPPEIKTAPIAKQSPPAPPPAPKSEPAKKPPGRS